MKKRALSLLLALGMVLCLLPAHSLPLTHPAMVLRFRQDLLGAFLFLKGPAGDSFINLKHLISPSSHIPGTMDSKR